MEPGEPVEEMELSLKRPKWVHRTEYRRRAAQRSVSGHLRRAPLQQSAEY